MYRALKIAVIAVAAAALTGTARAEASGDAGLQRAFSTSTAVPLARDRAGRWGDMLERMAAPATLCSKIDEAGEAECRFDAWRRQLVKLQFQPAPQQLAAVNSRINALRYVSDTANWGRADYWETPREMFARGGDCEGFALTKYFALRELGFAEQDMRIAVVWDFEDHEQHAVLVVRTDDGAVVLDNKRAEVTGSSELVERYRLLFYMEDGKIGLPALADTPRRAVSTSRIINGGRTLVMRVQPRRGRPGFTLAIPSAPPSFQMAMVETAAPAGE